RRRDGRRLGRGGAARQGEVVRGRPGAALRGSGIGAPMSTTYPPAVIELQRAGRTYRGTPPVAALRPCDLRVGRGDYGTVVGPSGSGKSTLLNLLGLLDRPTEGSYRLDGIDTGDLGENERTALRGQRLGFVFQSFHLIDRRTAVENVGLGLLYRNVPAAVRR